MDDARQADHLAGDFLRIKSMTSAEAHFRIALALILVVTMAVGIYHRIRAASSGEKISRREEGFVFAIVLRLAGMGLWASTLAYVVFPRSIQWASMPLPDGVRWLGVATGICSSLLMSWTLSHLGKNLTDTVVTRTAATLVTQGPYRWVRHPFYVTAALLMGSVTMLAANWLIGVDSLLVLVLLAIRTPKEEAMLVARFGSQYNDYIQRTGRFVPRVFYSRDAKAE